MKAITIKSDGTVEVTKISGKLKSLQDAVGGYIEALYLADDLVMLVNEDGLMRQLPINKAASQVAVMAYAANGRDAAIGSDRIVGDVLLVGDDGGEDFVSIPDDWEAKITALSVW